MKTTVLLNSGEFSVPYDWQPRILDVQLLRVGNVFIAGVPAEFTTMSGRRLRKAIKATLVKHYGEEMADDITVILSGPANGYAVREKVHWTGLDTTLMFYSLLVLCRYL